MTDPTRLEPKNGDFVAYLDALQEESLEELRRANQAAISNPLKVPDAGEGETNLRQLEAEMKRRAQADRAQSPRQSQTSADIEAARRAKESVMESFRKANNAGSAPSPAQQPMPQSAPQPAPVRLPTSMRKPKPGLLGFIGGACIMIGFFLTFALVVDEEEELAGPFIFLMCIGVLLIRIAKARR